MTELQKIGQKARDMRMLSKGAMAGGKTIAGLGYIESITELIERLAKELDKSTKMG